MKSLRIGIFTLQLPLFRVLLGVLKLTGEVIDLLFLAIKLLFELNDLLSQLRHLRNLLSDDHKLSLSLFELQVDHPDLFLLLSDLLLAVLQNVLLDVALLVEDTELIIFVNELNTHVVSRLASHLVLEDQVVHFLLQRVDDQVEFITLVDLLPDDAHPVLVSELILVQFGPQSVSLLNLDLHILLTVG